MKRFEYHVEIVQHRDGTHSATIDVHWDEWLEATNRLGQDGWELIETAGSMLRFKREIDRNPAADAMDRLAGRKPPEAT